VTPSWDAELACQSRDGARWRFGRIVEEGANEAHGAELQGETEAHMIAAPPVDHVPVGIIQMEKAGQLFRGRLPGITPVPALLLIGQKADGHGGFAELTTSSARSWSISRASCGRSRFAPEIFSS
jgi:hypothetical protein